MERVREEGGEWENKRRVREGGEREGGQDEDRNKRVKAAVK